MLPEAPQSAGVDRRAFHRRSVRGATGCADVPHWRSGALERARTTQYLGRNDRQVKVKAAPGSRPAEVEEAALLSHPIVKQSRRARTRESVGRQTVCCLHARQHVSAPPTSSNCGST